MNIELLKKIVSDAGDSLATLADDMNIGEDCRTILEVPRFGS